jgi:hypothetical protein
MSKPEQSPKTNKKSEELKTEGPLSEKDEVKAAETKATKRNKTALKILKDKEKHK